MPRANFFHHFMPMQLMVVSCVLVISTNACGQEATTYTREETTNLVRLMEGIKAGVANSAFLTEKGAKDAVGIENVEWGGRFAGPVQRLNRADWVDSRLSLRQRVVLSNSPTTVWDRWLDAQDTPRYFKFGLRALDDLGCVSLQDVERIFGPQVTELKQIPPPLHGAPWPRYRWYFSSQPRATTDASITFSYVYDLGEVRGDRPSEPSCLTAVFVDSANWPR